jgi:hypothetical protein
MVHRFRGFRMLLLLPLLSGCARPSVLHVDHPAPARPAASLEVLLDMPERPFRTVAIIRSPHADLIRSVEKLKRQVIEKAAELGADAVVLSLWEGVGSAGGAGVTFGGELLLLTRAGPWGRRRPCSQFWSVRTLIPSSAANFSCDRP